MNEVLAIVLSALGTVLTAVLSWATQRLIVWLNSKIKNAKAIEYLSAATEVVSSVVKQTYQSYVESLKGTDAWTKEAQENALKSALQTAQGLMSTEVKDYITSTYGDLNVWLTAGIESKIYDLKKV